MLAACALLCAVPAASRADERQYKIEAAFLYNFFNYITWPGTSSPQALEKPVICVYGDDPILNSLDYIRGKTGAERELTVRKVSDTSETEGCNILFMRHRISPRMLGALPNSTLTVFKPDDPLDRGGMIELSEDDERITIKINQSQLAQNGFQVSSRLLNLAQLVK
jgi:hypothetical protein